MDPEVKFTLEQSSSSSSNDTTSITSLNESPDTLPTFNNEQTEKETNDVNETEKNDDTSENEITKILDEETNIDEHLPKQSTFTNMIKKHLDITETDSVSNFLSLNDSINNLSRSGILKTSTNNEFETIIQTILNQNELLNGSSANSSSSSTTSETNKLNQSNLMPNLIDEHRLLNKNLSMSKKVSKSKKPWYSVFTNSYKQKNEDFRRLFKLPPEEHLLVDYSCALQREILAHGRLYVSSNHVCFRANIIGWETNVILKLKEIRSLVKDKTAKIIPNAISIVLDNEKFFLTSFVSRDKTYTTLVKVWQNALSDGSMTFDEISGILKGCYGEDLGYNSDDIEFEYYSKLRLKPSSDNFDLSESIDKSFNSTTSSPIIINKNLDNIDEINSYSDDQANIKMKKDKNSLSASSSSSSFGPSNIKFSTPTSFNPGHRQSSSYDTSMIDINDSLEVLVPVPNTTGVFIKRPRSMVVEKSLTKRHLKTLSSPISPGSEPNLKHSSNHNSSTDLNNNEANDQTSTTSTSAYSPLTNNTTSSSKLIESSMIGQTSINSTTSPNNSSQSTEQFDKNLEASKDNAKCSCTEHQGKELLNQVFNMSVNQLFECLFGHSEFCQKYWESRKFGNLIVGDWKPVHSLPARRLEYTVDLGGTLGRPKNTEDQKVLEYRPDVCIVLESHSVTHGVPYADYFAVINRFCLTRITSNQTRVTANFYLNFKKSPNFIIKSFIEKNSVSAVKDSFAFLVSLVKEIYDKKCHDSSTHLIENCFHYSSSCDEIIKKNNTSKNRKEKNLPDYPNLPEKKPNISAITSEQTRKSLLRIDSKLSSEELDQRPEPRHKTSIKRPMKKRHAHSVVDNRSDDATGHHHHHHIPTHHHQTPQINSSLSHQTQLVPIQKFSFFRWEINVDTLVRLFIVAMVGLMIINGMLYYKLRRIESLADNLKSDPTLITKLSNPTRQFERALLNTDSSDTDNWQSMISNTLDAISKMENSLKQLEKKFLNRDQDDL